MEQTIKDPGRSWQMALALLFCLFLAGMAVSIATAVSRGSRVVDVDYYRHGLHYGKTGSGASNAGLGWSMSATLTGGELRVRVQDRSGVPVAGGSMSFQPDGRTTPAATLALAEQAPGLFQARWPLAQQGELRGTLFFTRGEAAASQKLAIFN